MLRCRSTLRSESSRFIPIQGVADPHTAVTVNHLKSYEYMGQFGGCWGLFSSPFVLPRAFNISCMPPDRASISSGRCHQQSEQCLWLPALQRWRA